MIPARPTFCQIDLGAYAHNLDEIARAVGTSSVVPVLKAEAYGHTLAAIVPVLVQRRTERVAVAFVEEARSVRALGFTGRIHVLGAAVASQVAAIDDVDIEHTVASIELLHELVEAVQGRSIRVHLKFDTGMGRLGTLVRDAEPLLVAAASVPNVEVVGVFSHFANADAADLSDAQRQLERFETVIELIDTLGLPRPLLHMANSGAVAQLPDSHLDLVRPGILSYGVYPAPETRRTIDVRPVLSWHTSVVFAKAIERDWPVSYGSTWKPSEPTTVVTLPVGYGDGYRRALSNTAAVLIDGVRRPIRGRVCMDQTVVDMAQSIPPEALGQSVVGLPFVHRPVVLVGEQGNETITVEELAELSGTIAYEVLTGISGRVPRVTL
jgi:alanine racemase